MTDHDPAPSPEEERVRALLAGLGSPATGERMPPEVAARLEDTLADLVAERGDAGTSTPIDDDGAPARVVPLRARWLPAAAVAAAVVAVLGAVGVGSGAFRSLTDSTTAAKSSDAGAASEPRTAPPAQELQEGSSGSGDKAAGLPAVGAATFAADVARLLRGQDLRTPAPAAADDGAPEAARLGCPGPTVTDGSALTAITYDGRPAVLVVHPARSGPLQLVEAWSCDGDIRLAGAEVAP